MNEADKRKALGRGLSSLLPNRPAAAPAAAPAPPPTPAASPTKLPLDTIRPNPKQPRTVFRPEQLEELAASIRANGIIQPIIVRKVADYYEIVAGERRWRAAKLAELAEVPVVQHDIEDKQLLEVALIENIQREDLNPIETAHAFERLGRELGLSQEEMAKRTGKDRTTITNLLRLLKLPVEIQLLLVEHRLSMGHARAILGLPLAEDQIELANKAAAQGMSVRQVEAAVQEATAARDKQHKGPRRDQPQDPNVRAAVEELERSLGTRVKIVELSEQRGRIEIEYFSQAELDRIYTQIIGR